MFTVILCACALSVRDSSLTRLRHGARTVVMSTAAAAELPGAELCKLFGRVADKIVLMDESAGACCHSGCDGCPFRYSFDVLEAAAPKWITTYVTKTIGEREHTPLLLTTAFAGERRVTRDDFVRRVTAAGYTQPIGPALGAVERIGIKNAPELSPDIASAFFTALAGADAETLTAPAAAKRLREWAGGKDGLMYDEFVVAIRAALSSA